MKTTLFLLVIPLLLSHNFQSEKVVSGIYEKSGATSPNSIKYTLELKPDGTFYFHAYTYIEKSLNPETNIYAKGKWALDKKVITLSASESDITEIFLLNLNGTKGRFISKSPRDKSDRKVPTSIRFFDSEFLQGWTLLKK